MQLRLLLALLLMTFMGLGCPTANDDDSAGDDDDATGDDDDSAGDDDDAVDPFEEATADNDTFTAPLFDVNFQGSGAPDTFDADDDISSPLGDTEDWISFRTPSPDQATVGMTFNLTCSAAAPTNVAVEIWTGGSSPTVTSDQVNCAVGTDTFQLDVATDYLARVHWSPAQTTQVYSTWDLNICYGVGC